MKAPLLSAIVCIVLSCASLSLHAQFPYSETFRNSTAPGVVVSGSAKLTAASGIDAEGQGYLRFTDNTVNNVGCVYGQTAFPSNYGLTVSFEFYSYKTGATAFNQADGLSFFLFDGSVNAFRPGGSGGSLGYAQYYNIPGMAKGYLGISLDEFGNFSSATDGSKNGGPGQQRGSVSIRGPGNGRSATDYVYQTGVIASDPAYNAGFLGFTQRYPDPTTANYRKLKIIITPGSSLGTSIGYKITVIMYKGGASLTPVTLINNFDYPFVAPAQLKFGMAASTGSITNYHEIRNMSIDVTNTSTLLEPTVTDDIGTVVCQGGQAIVDVTANDHSNNSGGLINKSTIDLDPSVAGKQTVFTDPGKGIYSADSNGVVTFVPVSGFSGISTVSYKTDDTYGISSATAATITVTVNASSSPALTIVNPSPVCAPQLVDITSSTYRSGTTPGATYDYFNSLANANSNTGNINATATAISQSGTYYVRAAASGCATVRPMTVQINQVPSASNAGTDQTFCSATSAQSSTLLASNPDIGIGTWSQVSGPSAALITYPNSATSPVSNMAKGVYTFRWSIVNGACAASIDDVQVSVGISSNAGTSQVLGNGTAATLQGNDPAPATGAWSQVSGPALTISTPSNPASGVTGLVPGNTYVLSWRIANGSCTSTSQVTITNVLNTIANAGPDQYVTSLLPFLLGGNSPDAGNTGNWTMISGPTGNTAAISLVGTAVTAVNLINKVGDYTFRWTITNGIFSNSDDVTIHVSSLLPVTLLSFTAKPVNGTVMLQWETVSEQSNKNFEIERSVDGSNYNNIGIVAGAGTSGINHSYSFGDDVRNLDQHVVYYRLKPVADNGAWSYSRVVKVMLGGRVYFQAWPNPFTATISIKAYVDHAGAAHATLFDQSGKIVWQKEYVTVEGYNLLTANDLPSAAGSYVLDVVVNGVHYNRQMVRE